MQPSAEACADYVANSLCPTHTTATDPHCPPRAQLPGSCNEGTPRHGTYACDGMTFHTNDIWYGGGSGCTLTGYVNCFGYTRQPGVSNSDLMPLAGSPELHSSQFSVWETCAFNYTTPPPPPPSLPSPTASPTSAPTSWCPCHDAGCWMDCPAWECTGEWVPDPYGWCTPAAQCLGGHDEVIERVVICVALARGAGKFR